MSKPSVAIFGLNGTLGAPTLNAIQTTFADKFSFPVLAVTRDTSKVTSTDKVKYIKGDYINGTSELAEQLKGTDVIIELVSPNPDLFAAIESIVTQVKPKLFIPTQFGCDLEAAAKTFPGFLGIKKAHSDKIRETGIKVVDVYNGFFAEGAWLYEIIGHVGADLESKTVTYFNSPSLAFSYSSLKDVGLAIASVASKPVSELPDKVRIQSGTVTFEEVVKKYEETHNVKLEVKEVVPKEEVIKQSKEVWGQGFNPAKFLYYLQVLASLGPDGGVTFSSNDDELVNPGESLWKWTKY
ncbi:putative eugenol synthase [Clavispora lusitaniae]|uniref:Eugenol synthase n=1 Tax=Clavispora lusitaniae TaxID=36911 RepID=A0ACD0WIQ1_CLALS|nr:putative eugenol synthase [Clavispora lusitaniae]QFZ33503.1 putative eugenol synthase [Clavispora lusitaniae]QFZ39174.1 putative eugenol synthase [Clavispora lusitaniae]QFZ44856.1 putative eugenol synthase [Clavispora lusitaniae]QFZ50533.1 putative eugenol synthase [Clavispora lusitaniae]